MYGPGLGVGGSVSSNNYPEPADTLQPHELWVLSCTSRMPEYGLRVGSTQGSYMEVPPGFTLTSVT